MIANEEHRTHRLRTRSAIPHIWFFSVAVGLGGAVLMLAAALKMVLEGGALGFALMGLVVACVVGPLGMRDAINLTRLVTKAKVSADGMHLKPVHGRSRNVAPHMLKRGFTATTTGDGRERYVYCGVVVGDGHRDEIVWWMFFESYEKFESDVRELFPHIPWSHSMSDVPSWRYRRRWPICDALLPADKRFLPKGWKPEDEAGAP